MKRYDLTIRVLIDGVFDDVITAEIETDAVDEQELHDTIMREGREFVEDAYADYSQWDDGTISWNIDYHEKK